MLDQVCGCPPTLQRPPDSRMLAKDLWNATVRGHGRVGAVEPVAMGRLLLTCGTFAGIRCARLCITLHMAQRAPSVS